MEYLDEKDIFDPKEMLWSLDRLLELHGLEKISDDEKNDLEKKIQTAGNDQNKIANAIISGFDDVAITIGHKVLWFDENGDSYSYFIVKPEVYENLKDMRLDQDHKFYRPQF